MLRALDHQCPVPAQVAVRHHDVDGVDAVARQGGHGINRRKGVPVML